MHSLLYKYKKYGKEMLAEANWKLRTDLMREADELTEQHETLSAKEVMKKYDELLKTEEKEVTEFTL